MSLDLVLGETYDFKFTTRAFATGIPTTLAGTPGLQIYANNSATPLGYAPVLSVDVNSVNGLNNVRVVATSGNGFASGSSYAVVISAGTVGGVSVVGEVIKEFTVERAPVNWNKVRNATSTLVLTNTTIGTCTANTDMRGTNNALLAASAPANWSNFAITAGGAITVGTNNDKAGYTASSVTDKTGYSIAGTKTTLDALNDITAAAVWAVATRSLTDKAGFTISGTKQTLDALNDITAASVWAVVSRSLTDKAGFDLAADQTGVVIGQCNVNADMRGTDDAALAATALSTAVWTAARAGYLDSLNTGVVISQATRQAIADEILNRDMSVVADTNSRSPLNALRLLRNFWNVANGVLTVRKENDTDEAWTANVTGQAGANPIVSSDPN